MSSIIDVADDMLAQYLPNELSAHLRRQQHDRAQFYLVFCDPDNVQIAEKRTPLRDTVLIPNGKHRGEDGEKRSGHAVGVMPKNIYGR